MPVTSKEVQTVFCGLFCIIKELNKTKKETKKTQPKTKPKQTQPSTLLFIDKIPKIAKLQSKNSTDVNTACSKFRVQFIKKKKKKWQAANSEELVERLNRNAIRKQRYLWDTYRVCATCPKNLRKKVVLFYIDVLHPLKSEGKIVTESLMLLKKCTQALGTRAAFRSETNCKFQCLCLTRDHCDSNPITTLNQHKVKSGGWENLLDVSSNYILFCGDSF